MPPIFLGVGGKKINLSILGVSILSLALLSNGIMFGINDASAGAPIPITTTVYPLIPTQEGTFDTWETDPNSDDKAEAVSSDDGDLSYILRMSNSKWQTFILNDTTTAAVNPVPDDATILSVTLFASVRNDGEKTGKIALGCETGNNNKNIYKSGDIIIAPSEDYNLVSFEFLQNPATKPLRDWETADMTTWITDGKQMACGILNKDKQNAAPMFVTEFYVEIARVDDTPPIITPNFPAPTGDNGWHTGDFELSWTVVDPESPFVIDSGCVTETISLESDNISSTCTATSGGGTSSVTETFKLDKTIPVLTLPNPPTPVQAPDPSGAIMSYDTATATDATSGMAGPVVCSPLSNTLFVIGFTDVVCDATDNAGLVSSDSFVVQVNPYLAFIAFDSEIFELNSLATVTVADPFVNVVGQVDSISVELFSTAAMIDDPSRLSLILEETGDDDGTFEGDVLFAIGPTNDGTVIPTAFPVLHVDDLAEITAVYPFEEPIPSPRQSNAVAAISEEEGEGGVGFNLLGPLEWDNDLYIVGNGASIKSNLGAGCGVTTRDVHVSSTVSTGFDVTLVEDSPGSCTFTSPQLITLIKNGSTNESKLKLKVAIWNLATVDDTPSGGTNINKAIMIPTPTSTPVGGTVFDSDALTCGTGNDNDQDGLCNIWETPTGLEIPFGTNGAVYTYPCRPLIDDTAGFFATGPDVCPDPDRKDIFVEIDFMLNHKPIRLALQTAIDTFANSPVANPDGSTGITLHFLVDENTLDHDPLLSLTEFYQTKAAKFGTVAERTGAFPSDIITAKRQAFHWMYMVHSQEANPLSSGYAEVGANDSMISMGPYTGHTGTVQQQTSTIIHELGHNLHLNHGGSETNTQNCKPQYLSVMNYLYQFRNFVNDRPLDLSHDSNVNLNEASPDENVGLNASVPPGLTAAYGPFNLPAPLNGQRTVTLNANTPIDWDRDGDIGVGPTAFTNLNLFPISGCLNDDGYPAITLLTGFNDWQGMDLHFRESAGFAEGISSLAPVVLGGGDQGSLEFDANELPLIGERPVAIAGDENGPAINDEINVDEGVIFFLTSYSTDSDGTIDPSPDAEPFGIGWDLSEPSNGLFDDDQVDAHGNSTAVFADDDESGGANGGTGTFPAVLRVNDNDGNPSDPDDAITIIVHNVIPTVTADFGVEINEGDTIIIPAGFTDPGILDTHTGTFDWGDGSAVEDGVVDETLGIAPVIDPPAAIVLTSGTLEGSHTYLDDEFGGDDIYHVTVSVIDKDLGVGTANFNVLVNNVAPTVTAGADPAAVDEGTEVSFADVSFTDPGADTWNATVNYGDGSDVTAPVSVESPFSIDPHTYVDDTEGPYTVTVTVTDDDGGIGAASYTVTVNNIAPVLTAGANVTILYGEPAIITATFTDAGLDDTHTATVDYGDGPVNVTINPAFTLEIPDLTYDAPGVYPVLITVSDGTDSDSATQTITVDLLLDELDDPIGEPVDNTQYPQGRNVPVKSQFLDVNGVPIDSLTVKILIDIQGDVDAGGNEIGPFDASSTRRNVSDNIAKFAQNTGSYIYQLSTDVEDIPVPDNEMTTVHVIVRVIAGDGSTYQEWFNPIVIES